MGFAALGRATGGRRLTYGARPKEGEPEAQGGDGMHNRTEVASANAMAAEMAAVWCGKYERGDVRAVPYST